MYLQNYFCTLRVFDGQVFLETDILEFLLNIAYRKCRTIGTKVHIKQYINVTTSQIFTKMYYQTN